MKKLFITSFISAILSLSALAQIGTPIALSPSTGGTFPLLSTGCKVKYISLSSAVAGTVQFYDNSGTNTVGGTNYIASAYTGYTNYITNTVATNYVGTTGVTNYYTNSGLWTVSYSVPLSTNALNPTAAFAVAGGTVGSYPVDLLFSRGVNVRVSTNISVVLYYVPNQ